MVSAIDMAKKYGDFIALHPLNVQVHAGEFFGVFGPNGAGKSTFFKCLTGQLSPTSGDVVIRDIIMTGREPHAIASLGVGIKTQVPNLFDELSTVENLWLSARRWHGDRRANTLVKETIDRLELGEIRSSIVGSLAHGQRQMVELGMVVAAEPWLVLLDEPAAGMTDEETFKTAELVREINKTSALIVVEHDMNFIRAISDIVTLFHQGSIFMEDKMDVISADPRAREIYLGHKT